MARKPKFTNADVFALAAELFYQPGLSLTELSDYFQCSTASIKHMIRYLRKGNVICGMPGSSPVRLNLALLPNPKVVVTIERDTEQLKAMAKGKPRSYDAQKELLIQLCNKLPRDNDYKGRIIVEAGYMLGTGELFGELFDLLLFVHGASNNDLLNFVMYGINMTKGVRSSKTLMVAYTAGMSGAF